MLINKKSYPYGKPGNDENIKKTTQVIPNLSTKNAILWTNLCNINFYPQFSVTSITNCG